MYTAFIKWIKYIQYYMAEFYTKVKLEKVPIKLMSYPHYVLEYVVKS